MGSYGCSGLCLNVVRHSLGGNGRGLRCMIRIWWTNGNGLAYPRPTTRKLSLLATHSSIVGNSFELSVEYSEFFISSISRELLPRRPLDLASVFFLLRRNLALFVRLINWTSSRQTTENIWLWESRAVLRSQVNGPRPVNNSEQQGSNLSWLRMECQRRGWQFPRFPRQIMPLQL